MELTKDNIVLFAAKYYTNENCSSMEEFEEDLHQSVLSKKLARKIISKSSVNIRLLCNHVQCFTNNFELQAAKKILMFEAKENEKKVIKTVLNYFGFIQVGEMNDTPFCLETAKMLKEMDR
jgi:hypothetical protein